jgi:broad specificity phosphatase PhoE
MMKRHITILFILLGISTVSVFLSVGYAQNSNELFTIYLVRHSEKDLTSDIGGGPPLTKCGAQRSEHLSGFLSHVHLDAVYSTDYTRTKNTARPTANSKGLEVQKYSTENLEVFAELLIERKQDALVVGHSNTTGVLAGLMVDEDIGEFNLDIYNRIYQVVFCENDERLHLFHTAFSCDD